MKNEPWRGDASARCRHLEARLAAGKRARALLEARNAALRTRSDADRDEAWRISCRCREAIDDMEHWRTMAVILGVVALAAVVTAIVVAVQ